MQTKYKKFEIIMVEALNKNNQQACILVIEHEHRLLKSLESILRSEGHYVVCAQDASEACDYLSSLVFDLVLLDLDLPDMNGHIVMDFINLKELDVVTIVLSGETSFSAVSRSFRRGAYDYLRTPFEPEVLLDTVSRAIQSILKKEAEHIHIENLERSESLHRCIVNSSPDIVFMLDKSGNFTFLNNKIEIDLGYKKEELIGLNYQVIFDPRDLDYANSFFLDQVKNKKDTWVGEFRLKPKNERERARYYELSSFPIEIPDRRYVNSIANTSGLTHINGTCVIARDVSKRKQAEEFILFQAYHDTLTRLPNRALFKDRLKVALTQAKRNNRNMAVLFMDLNGFKKVNDSFGHRVGDQLLQIVARRMNGCLRKCDTLSRFGGDEFALLLPMLASPDDIRTVAEKITMRLNEPFLVAEHKVSIGVSIGISVYPDDGETIEQLIESADIAMYRSKSLDEPDYQYFGQKVDDTPLRRRSSDG